MNAEWQQVLDAEVGHIFHDGFDNDVRYLIMRGPASLCAYLGVPKEHPLAGFGSEDISIECHGGLTFGGTNLKGFPDNWHWYGWDYAHSGDRSTYDDLRPSIHSRDFNETRWTVAMVKKEISSATYDFKKLKQLAERIAERAKAL